MRQIALMTAAAAIFASGPAAAAWQVYPNEALGYNIMLPGKPTEATGVYRSDIIRSATTHYSTLKDGGTTFIALEIDTGYPEEGAVLMGEFEYWLSQIGDITLDNLSRLNLGMQYGRFVIVDCRTGIENEGPKRPDLARQILKDAANLVCPNGARLTANLFFTQGRLYAITGIVTGDDAKTSSAPARFANSLEWIGANAEHGRTLFDTANPPARAGVQQGAAQQPPAAAGGGR